jgi:hypothetical protein
MTTIPEIKIVIGGEQYVCEDPEDVDNSHYLSAVMRGHIPQAGKNGTGWRDW